MKYTFDRVQVREMEDTINRDSHLAADKVKIKFVNIQDECVEAESLHAAVLMVMAKYRATSVEV